MDQGDAEEVQNALVTAQLSLTSIEEDYQAIKTKAEAP